MLQTWRYRAAFGRSTFERAAWVRSGGAGGVFCDLRRWIFDRDQAGWPANLPPPDGSVAQVHTHGTRAPRSSAGARRGPHPSQADQGFAPHFGVPVYVVSPEGIWKYDPDTDRVTLEEPSNWTKGPKKRCKKRCDEVLANR